MRNVDNGFVLLQLLVYGNPRIRSSSNNRWPKTFVCRSLDEALSNPYLVLRNLVTPIDIAGVVVGFTRLRGELLGLLRL